MTAAASTDLQTLLTAIITQFTAVPPLNQYTAFLSANPDELEPEVADSYLAVKPNKFSVDQRTLTGGGNDDLYFIGSFDAWIHTRLDLDAGIRADEWFTNPSYGILPIIKCMIFQMNMFVVTSGSSVLTPVPIRMIDYGPFTRRKAVMEWGSCQTTWHLEYWHQFTCP
jgi:hypothetical protein